MFRFKRALREQNASNLTSPITARQLRNIHRSVDHILRAYDIFENDDLPAVVRLGYWLSPEFSNMLKSGVDKNSLFEAMLHPYMQANTNAEHSFSLVASSFYDSYVVFQDDESKARFMAKAILHSRGSRDLYISHQNSLFSSAMKLLNSKSSHVHDIFAETFYSMESIESASRKNVLQNIFFESTHSLPSRTMSPSARAISIMASISAGKWNPIERISRGAFPAVEEFTEAELEKLSSILDEEALSAIAKQYAKMITVSDEKPLHSLSKELTKHHYLIDGRAAAAAVMRNTVDGDDEILSSILKALDIDMSDEFPCSWKRNVIMLDLNGE